MSITLKPEQENFIQAKLQTGKYQTADEVILEAFQLLEERDRQYEQWVQETRIKVEEAIAASDRGERLNGEEVISQILERFRQAREAQG
ncbi:ribbon-helix-helix domain-containing protein [Iningainema tapete]|uniref:Type II toxin-antitoxin system ParD family antitoxin n=1 Tax=Iningainema tapete BLCC-T55 TaxID=2748662 RepID=A0A8J6XN27_9CYAN|nr:type II toxin-antitoxin system ParD family antitoxin [Iningainema tapete]MBD2776021.1 type II toxin-antitoxin system ParD family antitoxin [Iningainema tapete BLCC-T55]